MPRAKLDPSRGGLVGGEGLRGVLISRARVGERKPLLAGGVW